jgi:hypothetical protein
LPALRCFIFFAADLFILVLPSFNRETLAKFGQRFLCTAVFKVSSKRQVISEPQEFSGSPERQPNVYTQRKHPDTGASNHLKLLAPGAQIEKPRPVYLTKYSTNHNYCEFNGHRFWPSSLLGSDWTPDFYGGCRLKCDRSQRVLAGMMEKCARENVA